MPVSRRRTVSNAIGVITYQCVHTIARQRPVRYTHGSIQRCAGALENELLYYLSLSFLVKQPGGLGYRLHSKCSKCPPLNKKCVLSSCTHPSAPQCHARLEGRPFKTSTADLGTGPSDPDRNITRSRSESTRQAKMRSSYIPIHQ